MPLIERFGSFGLIIFFVTNVWLQQNKLMREIAESQKTISTTLFAVVESVGRLTEQVRQLENQERVQNGQVSNNSRGT